MAIRTSDGTIYQEGKKREEEERRMIKREGK